MSRTTRANLIILGIAVVALLFVLYLVLTSTAGGPGTMFPL
jgi:hypothetical protein